MASLMPQRRGGGGDAEQAADRPAGRRGSACRGGTVQALGRRRRHCSTRDARDQLAGARVVLHALESAASQAGTEAPQAADNGWNLGEVGHRHDAGHDRRDARASTRRGSGGRGRCRRDWLMRRVAPASTCASGSRGRRARCRPRGASRDSRRR